VDKQRGTALPDNDFLGIAASLDTYKRAKSFLVTQGVLEANDRPHYVALSRMARPSQGHHPR
jgi:hypothetical protein